MSEIVTHQTYRLDMGNGFYMETSDKSVADWIDAKDARVRALEEELRIGRQASEIVGRMAMQQKERAERAEAERDALRAEVARLRAIHNVPRTPTAAMRRAGTLVFMRVQQERIPHWEPEIAERFWIAMFDAALAGERP